MSSGDPIDRSLTLEFFQHYSTQGLRCTHHRVSGANSSARRPRGSIRS